MASERGSADVPFVEEPGEFDANQPAPEFAAPDEPSLEEELIEWETDVVEGVLTVQGHALHFFAGQAENDWRYTEADLKAISPPMVRILNRYPRTRAAAAYADPLLLFMSFGAYFTRSAAEMRNAQIAAQEEEQPVTGVGAPPQAAPPTPAPAPPPARTQSQPPVPMPVPTQPQAGPPQQAPIDPTQVEWTLDT